jgi:aconitase A
MDPKIVLFMMVKGVLKAELDFIGAGTITLILKRPPTIVNMARSYQSFIKQSSR